ncbi:hypothetical protein G9A89_010698 [Geosiphon pyriformis]|nr:hypothetical protein G9A89_010698 [Geosiphon pyriformis]
MEASLSNPIWRFIPTTPYNWTADQSFSIFTFLLISEIFHVLAHLKVLLSWEAFGGRFTAEVLWGRWYYFYADVLTALTSFYVIIVYLSAHNFITPPNNREDIEKESIIISWLWKITTVLVLGHLLLHAYYINGWFKGQKEFLAERQRRFNHEKKVNEKRKMNENVDQEIGRNKVEEKIFLGAKHVKNVLIWSAADSWNAKKMCTWHWRQTIGTSYDIFVHMALISWHFWILWTLKLVLSSLFANFEPRMHFFEHFDFRCRNEMISVDDFYYSVSGQDDKDPKSSRYYEVGRPNVNRSEGTHQLL